jgi:FdhD protein
MSSTEQRTIQKVTGREQITTHDLLSVEEPLEINLSYFDNSAQMEKTISITMRTPGNDEELAAGFLFTEGILQNREHISSIHSKKINSINIVLGKDVDPDLTKLERNFYTTSSCGVCGKSSIDSIITTHNLPAEIISEKISSSLLYGLPELLRSHQDVFEQTGGLHACAIFNSAGELLLLREDVGRHNALDKLVGAAFLENKLPLTNCILLLSGRASFELVQKATMAGIPIVAAVGAPSSLAVQLAEERNMTLIGFLKKERFNIYSAPARIDLEN